jgi:hypothetical protein
MANAKLEFMFFEILPDFFADSGDFGTFYYRRNQIVNLFINN